MEFITVVQHNCQGLRGNLVEIQEALKTLKPDIMCFSETFLSSSTAIKLPGYTVAARLEMATGRGGTLVAVKPGMDFQVLENKSLHTPTGHLEYQTIRISTAELTFLLVHMYASPEYKLERRLIEAMLAEEQFTLVVGDLNAKHIDMGSRSTNERGRLLHALEEEGTICVLNDLCPTHRSGNVLDFHLSSGPMASKFTSFAVVDGCGSDHYMTMSRWALRKIISDRYEGATRYDYRRTDWAQYRSRVAATIHADTSLWPPRVPREEEIEAHARAVTQILTDAKSTCIPLQRPRQETLPPSIVQLIRERRQARSQKNKLTLQLQRPYTLHTTELLANLKTRVNRLSNEIKRRLVEHRQQARDSTWLQLRENENNQSAFWRLLKKQSGTPATASRTIYHDGEKADSDPAKADLFKRCLEESMSKPAPPTSDSLGDDRRTWRTTTTPPCECMKTRKLCSRKRC